MKKITSLLLAAVAAISLSGCAQGDVSEQLTVPDVVGTEEAIAKNILSSSGFIPTVETQYNDDVDYGIVIGTSPEVGSPIEKNGKVNLFVSKGPKHMVASDAAIGWNSISNESDDWDFYYPYIDDGTLYIKCQPMFMVDVKWDYGTSGVHGFGRASINDTFDKTVPITIVTSEQTIKSGVRGNITLEIPLTDLDVQKPTTMHLELSAFFNGNEEKQERIKIQFALSW